MWIVREYPCLSKSGLCDNPRFLRARCMPTIATGDGSMSAMKSSHCFFAIRHIFASKRPTLVLGVSAYILGQLCPTRLALGPHGLGPCPSSQPILYMHSNVHLAPPQLLQQWLLPVFLQQQDMGRYIPQDLLEKRRETGDVSMSANEPGISTGNQRAMLSGNGPGKHRLLASYTGNSNILQEEKWSLSVVAKHICLTYALSDRGSSAHAPFSFQLPASNLQPRHHYLLVRPAISPFTLLLPLFILLIPYINFIFAVPEAYQEISALLKAIYDSLGLDCSLGKLAAYHVDIPLPAWDPGLTVAWAISSQQIFGIRQTQTSSSSKYISNTTRVRTHLQV
ncbi:hypothetical protein BDZ91DRAFT_781864 [Kalaharituber pfeilii]|nr:hypothetical protein BDZ91DRAFT_781864 [Kalaharituber pfeilii]